MNLQQFIGFVDNPMLLSNSSTPMMEDVVREFPYFQAAHLLYAKNLSNTGSIHYNTKLKIAAAYSADRKKLYELMMLKDEKHKDLAVEKQILQAPKNAEVILQVLKKPEEPKVTPSIVPEKASFEFDEITKLEKDAKTLDNEILANAFNIEIENEFTQLEPMGEEDMLVEPQQEAGAESPFEKKTSPEALYNIEKEVIPQANIQEPGNLSEQTFSFTNWLRVTSHQPIDTSGEKEEEKKSVMDLIDKFIDSEPKLTKPKKEFYSPIDKARKSVMDDDTLVTETLAKIYHKQGNYAKAIKSYEILSLKYPKKSVFFAARIEEIKKLMS